MADYPDYTRAHQIIGSNIMVPIDIQAAYIMMPVDIQAQYITLNIDIVAQSVGHIEVDLVAQSVGSIAINIAAQDLTNLNISINTQAVGLYYGGEWEVKAGNGWQLDAGGSITNFGDSLYDDYAVPTGKTLYINSLGFFVAAGAAASADLPQHGLVQLLNNTDTVILYQLGGDGGGGMTFPSPLSLAAGKTLRLLCYSEANHAVIMSAVARGFVI